MPISDCWTLLSIFELHIGLFWDFLSQISLWSTRRKKKEYKALVWLLKGIFLGQHMCSMIASRPKKCLKILRNPSPPSKAFSIHRPWLLCHCSFTLVCEWQKKKKKKLINFVLVGKKMSDWNIPCLVEPQMPLVYK